MQAYAHVHAGLMSGRHASCDLEAAKLCVNHASCTVEVHEPAYTAESQRNVVIPVRSMVKPWPCLAVVPTQAEVRFKSQLNAELLSQRVHCAVAKGVITSELSLKPFVATAVRVT